MDVLKHALDICSQWPLLEEARQQKMLIELRQFGRRLGLPETILRDRHLLCQALREKKAYELIDLPHELLQTLSDLLGPSARQRLRHTSHTLYHSLHPDSSSSSQRYTNLLLAKPHGKWLYKALYGQSGEKDLTETQYSAASRFLTINETYIKPWQLSTDRLTLPWLPHPFQRLRHVASMKERLLTDVLTAQNNRERNRARPDLLHTHLYWLAAQLVSTDYGVDVMRYVLLHYNVIQNMIVIQGLGWVGEQATVFQRHYDGHVFASFLDHLATATTERQRWYIMEEWPLRHNDEIEEYVVDRCERFHVYFMPRHHIIRVQVDALTWLMTVQQHYPTFPLLLIPPVRHQSYTTNMEEEVEEGCTDVDDVFPIGTRMLLQYERYMLFYMIVYLTLRDEDGHIRHMYGHGLYQQIVRRFDILEMNDIRVGHFVAPDDLYNAYDHVHEMVRLNIPTLMTWPPPLRDMLERPSREKTLRFIESVGFTSS
jgi:hypothetical protein